MLLDDNLLSYPSVEDLLMDMIRRRYAVNFNLCNTNARDVRTRASTAERSEEEETAAHNTASESLSGFIGIRTQRQKSLTEDEVSHLQDAGDRLPARAQA